MILMTNKLYKERHLPYRILGLILYGSHPFIETTEDGQIEIATGPFSRLFRITGNRLRTHVTWLHQMGLIESFSFSYGKVSVRPKVPTNLTRSPQTDDDH